MFAFLALQVAGFAVLYGLLRRMLLRRTSVLDVVAEARAEVAALIAELNGTTERNVALLEDGIRRLEELLRRVDGAAPESPAAARPPRQRGQPAGSAAGRRAEVLRLRRMGMSNEAIVERLATSPAEVELIVNLADGVPGRGPR